jgi:hypothetical protein
MRTRHYIITGILAYFVFLVTSIPAQPVIGAFKESLPVSIGNISGTLWHGKAGTVITRNNVKLDDVEWSFIPWRLLLARLAFDVNAEFNNSPLSTRVSTGIGRTVGIDDLDMILPASKTASLISLPIGELSGDIHLRIDKARFTQGSVPRVEGTVDWTRAAVTIAETADLGNISVVVSENEESPIMASISNKGGQLALNGNFTTTDQGNYSLKLNMKPGATASSNLASSLEMFAKKQRNGEFVLNNKGNLKQLGLM